MIWGALIHWPETGLQVTDSHYSVLAAFHTCHLLLQPVKVEWISGESRNGDKSANQSAESFDWQPI